MSATDDRFLTLDTVRGVAVLGILLLNIAGFALPEAAYLNPRAYGGWHGADLVAWVVNFILFDGKMRGLFSLLFGASMLLVIERAEASGRGPLAVHFSRMLWLLIFGLAHLYLVWRGDILAHYAMIGAFAFLFRRLSVPRLVALGIVLVLVETLIFAALPVGVAMLAQVPPGSPQAAEAVRQLAEFERGFGSPPAGAIAQELALYRGSYPGIVGHRLTEQLGIPLQLLFVFGPETLAYMLFGMAAFRSGLLKGEWPRAACAKLLALGFGIGIPVYAALAWYTVREQFDLFALVLGPIALATPVRPLMILGWACLIILLMRPGGALTTRLAAAGRMAFTNYLATSLICTTIFYGYGLGWFGYLGRAELYLVVAAVWALILLWSQPWLARFRYGPFEWLWRSLARGKLQPMRK
jgi:uncharacterized protein